MLCLMMAVPACATSASGGSDVATLERVVLQHVLEDLVPSNYPDWTGGFCVGRGTLSEDGEPVDPAASLLAAMHAAGIAVQPASTCTLPVQGTTETTDRASGERRLLVLLSQPDAQSADLVTFEAEYHAGPMAAAGWTCDATRTSGAWSVACRNLWQA